MDEWNDLLWLVATGQISPRAALAAIQQSPIALSPLADQFQRDYEQLMQDLQKDDTTSPAPDPWDFTTRRVRNIPNYRIYALPPEAITEGQTLPPALRIPFRYLPDLESDGFGRRTWTEPFTDKDSIPNILYRL